jgi:hypothetical protein
MARIPDKRNAEIFSARSADVKGIIRPADGKTDAENAEDYKDIPPLDTWLRSSLLGMHNKRSATGAGDQAVLVVRADLLYRYPNTAIYAQKALPGGGGPNDPRIEQNLTNDQFAKQINSLFTGARSCRISNSLGSI